MTQMASVLVVASVFISFWTLVRPIRETNSQTKAKSTGDYVGVLIIGFSSIK